MSRGARAGAILFVTVVAQVGCDGKHGAVQQDRRDAAEVRGARERSRPPERLLPDLPRGVSSTDASQRRACLDALAGLAQDRVNLDGAKGAMIAAVQDHDPEVRPARRAGLASFLVSHPFLVPPHDRHNSFLSRW